MKKNLSKLDEFIILTEKEIQLLELFLNNKKPISKDKILSSCGTILRCRYSYCRNTYL